MENKKASAYMNNIVLGIAIIFIGIVGAVFWGIGYILNNINSIWLGRLILSVLTIIVLIMERMLK